MNRLKNEIFSASLRNQLLLLFVVGSLTLVAIVSIATVHVSKKVVANNFVHDGRSLTESFAEKSILALLYQSKENASHAADALFSFPNVLKVAIYDDKGELLFVADRPGSTASPAWYVSSGTSPAGDAVHEYDHGEYYQFESKVVYEQSQLQEEGAFEPVESKTYREVLGTVRVLIDKNPIREMTTSILFGTFLVAVVVVPFWLIALHLVSSHLSRPLSALVQAMTRATFGETGLRVPSEGASEVRRIATSFNQMIGALEDREQKLRDANTKVLEYAQMKSEFTATVSHEIRTPLAGILGVLNLLDSTELSREQREFLTLAKDSGENLGTIINSILDFSKISSGQMKFVNTRIELEKILDDVLHLHAGTIKDKNIRMACICKPDVPTHVLSDPTRIFQIFNNLLSNAAKFTEAGEIRLTVSVICETSTQVFLRFEVSDTGIGIAEDEQASIFQPYAQIDGSINRKYEGTGLGLSITKELIELSEGTIDLKSVQGEGSCFRVDLPFLKMAEEDIEVPTPHSPRSKMLLLCSEGLYCDAMRNYLERLSIPYDWIVEPSELHSFVASAIERNEETLELLVDWSGSSSELLAMLEECRGSAQEFQFRIYALDLMKDRGQLMDHPWFAASLSTPLRWSSVRRTFCDTENTEVSIEQVDARSDSKSDSKKGDLSQQAPVVLLVEDNVVNQKVCTALLERQGVEVVLARNGVEAVEAVKEKSFSLVLMDCQMPTMDGFEATRIIRATEQSGARRVPIVAITASAEQEARQQSIAVGMDGFLTKPIDLQELARVLQDYVFFVERDSLRNDGYPRSFKSNAINSSANFKLRRSID